MDTLYISKKELLDVALMQPAAGIVAKFMEQVEPIDQQIANLHQATEKLARARDLLLPKLMRGELAV